jgi:hypothetical protein
MTPTTKRRLAQWSDVTALILIALMAGLVVFSLSAM